MSTIANLSPDPLLQNYAVGARQQNTRKVGEFLAPTVPSTTLVGRYKSWAEKSRFFVPKTIRALNGSATEISSNAADSTFMCTPNGLNYTVDKSLGDDADPLVKDGIDFLADIYGLAHLYDSINTAKAAMGAGTDEPYDPTIDPVDLIDDQINALILASKCETVGVLFGAYAYRRFKNHPLVAARRQSLDYSLNPSLFQANAGYMGCFSVIDEAPEGIDPDIQFLLQNEIIVFGASPVPNRRDPSFMKTFRVDGAVETVKVVESTDRRKLIVTSDWAAAIQVTNPVAVALINYLPAA